MPIYTTFKIDSSGDLDLSGGTINLVSDKDAIRAQLQIRLNEFINDWFLDLNEGIDYFGEVFGVREITDSVESQFKNVILDTVSVTSIQSISFDLSDRLLIVTFSVATIFGDIKDSTTVTL